MLFHNQTFEERLKFFDVNLCDFPEQLSVVDIEHTNPEEVILGLRELHQLFADIYKSVDVFQEADPLESLHNVTNTLLLLYSAGCVGELYKQGVKWYLEIDKKQIKGHFKQSLSKPMENLQKFGFYYEYYKNGSCVETLTKGTEIYIYCEGWNNALLALNYILQKKQLNLTNDDYTRMQGIFYKLDYKSIFLKESTKREEINPFRADIQKTAGINQKLLELILKRIYSDYPLKANIKVHEFYTPHWIFQFHNTNTNKYVFNLNVAADTVCIEIRLSSKTIENLALKKKELTNNLKNELGSLGCISCNNQCNKENLKETNGIHYCSTYSEARLIMLYINSEDEVNSAVTMLNFEILKC